MNMENAVYYLPGYGGRLLTGLGAALTSRGLDIAGRETVDEFRSMPFKDQVDTVAADLQDHFWNDSARVIANSFGAYLFLHAQAQMEPFLGRVLLLSPIVGEFSSTETSMNFIPPKAEALSGLIKAGKFKPPTRCEIHVGALDWQSNPDQVSELGRLLGIDVNVVPGGGHMLDKGYVGALLDRWL
jgi:hypothetical protein